MKLRGKIISIPIEKFTEGMQVGYYRDNLGVKGWSIGTILGFIESGDDCAIIKYSYQEVNVIASCTVSLSLLKTFMVRYGDVKQDENVIMRITNMQLPLKYSQWKTALENKLVDSIQEIDFEIKSTEHIVNTGLSERPTEYLKIGKIVIEEKSYTEQQMLQMLNDYDREFKLDTFAYTKACSFTVEQWFNNYFHKENKEEENKNILV